MNDLDTIKDWTVLASELPDSFGRTHNYMRVSLTDRCNLRCIYCMPQRQKFFPRSSVLDPEEISIICSVMVGLGVKKIRLTGGEPTLRPEFLDIVERIATHLQTSVPFPRGVIELQFLLRAFSTVAVASLTICSRTPDCIQVRMGSSTMQ